MTRIELILISSLLAITAVFLAAHYLGAHP